ncbi:MAG TPA: hypothetical protein VFM15_00770 [Gammaproteobacteria bacterium]|nr:hypothetical protein [Gammaproteobacteria bacterium]
MNKTMIFAALLLASPAAMAAPDIGVQAGAGTLGLNFGVNYRINAFVGVGGAINNYTYSRDSDYKGVNYSADLHLSSQMLVLNLYPFGGSFHVTGGWMHNGNYFALRGQPDANGNYTFDGNTYSASQVGTVSARMDFKSSATYLGIGWGGSGNWGLTFDLGVMRQGEPNFTLTASAAASNPQLASDVASQQAQSQDDVSSFTWYPQVKLGLYVNF